MFMRADINLSRTLPKNGGNVAQQLNEWELR